MTQILIIAIFICARLRDSLPAAPAFAFGWAWALLPPVLAAIVVAWAARRVMKAMDARGVPHFAGRAHTIAAITHIIAGLSLGASLLLTDWPLLLARILGRVPLLADLAAISPLLFLLIANWASLYPIERRLRDALLLRQLDTGRPIYPPPTRAQYLWNRARFEILLILVPIALASLWHQALERLPALFEAPGSPSPGLQSMLAALSWLGLPLVLILGPAVLRYVWDLVPIGPGPLRDAADAMCRQYRVRVRGPFLWRTHGQLINAAILGVAYPFRYLLFTDAMLDTFPADQLEAVMAHEVAHVRERHLIWMGVTLAASLFTLPWIIDPLLPDAPGPFAEVLVAAIILAFVGLVFGFVSRRFEWQADAFSVRHLSRRLAPASPTIAPDAAHVVARTLLNVAELNGLPAQRFSFRHGSIAARCDKVLALVGRPIDTLPQDRAARLVKHLSALLLSLALAATLLDFLMDHP